MNGDAECCRGEVLDPAEQVRRAKLGARRSARRDGLRRGRPGQFQRLGRRPQHVAPVLDIGSAGSAVPSSTPTATNCGAGSGSCRPLYAALSSVRNTGHASSSQQM